MTSNTGYGERSAGLAVLGGRPGERADGKTGLDGCG